MTERKKRNIIIGSLCGVLLLMVVGYAAFSSILKIKGTSTISSNWDIKITSIKSNVLHGSATNAKDPEGVGTLTASFETNLVSPGDSIKYTITVANQGNINAKLDKITLSEPDNEYVTFETSGLTEGEPLNAGSTADLKVIVTFKDEEINKMDTSTSKLTVQLDYSQLDNSSETPGPNESYAADDLRKTVVTTGDGLYKDEYEEGRYVYKGSNPNNYITFNNETWRILAVETDGTIKIMKKDSLGNLNWNTNNSNDWTFSSTLNTYLNNDYYNTLNNAQSLIQEHSWGIGPVIKDNTDLITQITSEKRKIWTGNIGLMTVSDFLNTNTNIEQCNNYSLNNSNKEICKTTNYIVPSEGKLWTISPEANSPFKLSTVSSDGTVYNDITTTYRKYGVLPVLHLIPNITLSGSGTSDNPYTINS